MKKYAGFIQAVKASQMSGVNFVTSTKIILLEANCLDEAMGISYRLTKETYPADQGYGYHLCDVMEISDNTFNPNSEQ